ncbi:MAG TPA: GFA family protein [Chthoniobacterales bacterium]|nr:GFA family protein [Chthoniobacterales bacterium]
MAASFSGGCACGAIRYECSAKPIAMFNCHCRDCQRATGSAFSAVVYVLAKTFKITKGSPRYYFTTSEMIGQNQRGFCAECGSRLFGGVTEKGQGINASSLDDPSLFKPRMHIWTSDAQPWDHMDPTLPKFEKYQPSS